LAPSEQERHAEWRGEIEARVNAMEREIGFVRQRHHDAMNAMQQTLSTEMVNIRRALDQEPPWMDTLVQKVGHGNSKGENAHVTRREITLMIGGITLGASTAIWLFKTFGG
jgi:hypothetical protein